MTDAASCTEPWWVYIIQTDKGLLYTGITTDVQRRFLQHKGDLKGGAKFFRGHTPKAVVYRQACLSRSQASKREAQIKRLSRAQKLRLIQSSL